MIKQFVTTGAEYGVRADPTTGLDKEIEEFIKNLEGGNPNGVFCTPVAESVPTHLKAGCEIVYPGMRSPHNTFIVLGRDRYESLASGKGGKGATKCGMIDIVVGKGAMTTAKRVRMGPIASLNPLGTLGPGNELKGEDVMGPSFINDAARIYISAATDDESGGIDDYLGLPYSPQIESGGKSAIAVKADHTRIVGRECVRIFAGSSRSMEGSFLDGGGETNVLGNDLDKARIELIAGNTSDIEDSDLHPVVLGNNLREYFQEFNRDVIYKILDVQRGFARQIGTLCITIINLCLKSFSLVGAASTFGVLIEQIVQYIQTWITQIDSILGEINHLDLIHFRGAKSIFSATVFTT
jgi:hypothetical protein